ncbi:uncharacterized protein [Medicago truncatula]|uniref:uncharacterized protein n=1 Tax=Medicago truncatula TaxID=3880 RepID=UPI000D2F2121|nr:uncharacterized protein LOC11441797 [Medicago truncatula]
MLVVSIEEFDDVGGGGDGIRSRVGGGGGKKNSLSTNDLLVIAECFPLREELDLSYPSGCKHYTNYLYGVEALSETLFKLRKVNLSGLTIIEQSLFHLLKNCNLLQEVILFNCDRKNITQVGIASALRERPTLTSFSFFITPNVWDITSDFIKSLVSLKGLTSLNLQHLGISDKLLYSIAKECLPLTSLVLQNAYFLNNQHVVNLSLLLGDLVSINLSRCYKITKLALFALAKNCPSLSEIKMERIGNEIVENSESSMELGVYPQFVQ